MPNYSSTHRKNNFCCMAGCQYQKSSTKKAPLGLFKASNRRDVFEMWVQLSGNDNVLQLSLDELRATLYFCEQHFADNDIHGGAVRKRISFHTTPSIFPKGHAPLSNEVLASWRATEDYKRYWKCREFAGPSNMLMQCPNLPENSTSMYCETTGPFACLYCEGKPLYTEAPEPEPVSSTCVKENYLLGAPDGSLNDHAPLKRQNDLPKSSQSESKALSLLSSEVFMPSLVPNEIPKQVQNGSSVLPPLQAIKASSNLVYVKLSSEDSKTTSKRASQFAHPESPIKRVLAAVDNASYSTVVQNPTFLQSPQQFSSTFLKCQSPLSPGEVINGTNAANEAPQSRRKKGGSLALLKHSSVGERVVLVTVEQSEKLQQPKQATASSHITATTATSHIAQSLQEAGRSRVTSSVLIVPSAGNIQDHLQCAMGVTPGTSVKISKTLPPGYILVSDKGQDPKDGLERVREYMLLPSQQIAIPVYTHKAEETRILQALDPEGLGKVRIDP